MTSERFLAFAVAVETAAPGRTGLLGRLGRPVEMVTVEPPAAPAPTTLFRPSGSAPRAALLALHGLAQQGRADPRLVALGRNLAAAGMLVIVPEVASWKALRIQPDDAATVGRLLSSARDLAGPDLPLSAAGFSYTAAPLLVAAARDAGATRLDTIYSVGGPYDLRDLISFALTGVCEESGVRRTMTPDPWVRRIALDLISSRLDPSQAGRLEALERETDPVRAIDRVRALDNALLVELWRLSPASVIPDIPGRVVVTHTTTDRIVPFTESLRLHRALKSRGPVRHLPIPAREHMVIGGIGAFRAVWALSADLIQRRRTRTLTVSR